MDCVEQAGFDIKEGTHPIVPIMLFDAALAGEMAQKLLQRGLYLTAFSYPVVPKGQARIRVSTACLPPVFHISEIFANNKLCLGTITLYFCQVAGLTHFPVMQ